LIPEIPGLPEYLLFLGALFPYSDCQELCARQRWQPAFSKLKEGLSKSQKDGNELLPSAQCFKFNAPLDAFIATAVQLGLGGVIRLDTLQTEITLRSCHCQRHWGDQREQARHLKVLSKLGLRYLIEATMS
jgi:hypothetical protein